MRGLLWITAIALAGFGLLFLAWRLLPADARETAQPAVDTQAEPPPSERQLLTPVGPASSEPERAAAPPPAAPEAPPVVEAPPANGLEEGGLTQAARPLPDFSAKYEGTLRSDRLLATRTLEEQIETARAALSPTDLTDLDARLANQPRHADPSPAVGALLALHDELAWLRQQLTQPKVDDR